MANLFKKGKCKIRVINRWWFQPVDGFKWVEENDLSKFNKKFIKSYNENSDQGYFLEVDVKYPKKSS